MKKNHLWLTGKEVWSNVLYDFPRSPTGPQKTARITFNRDQFLLVPSEMNLDSKWEQIWEKTNGFVEICVRDRSFLDNKVTYHITGDKDAVEPFINALMEIAHWSPHETNAASARCSREVIKR